MGSVRARASQDRLSWDEPIQGHAACRIATTVTLLRRWRSLRRSAGTCWWWREQGRRKFRPPLCEKRPYTQPSPRRPGVVARALTEPPEQLHTGKEETHGIERDNARQRHWLARFRRCSIVVSKAQRMVDVSIALFARFAAN